MIEKRDSMKNNVSKKHDMYVLERDKDTNEIIPRDNEGILLNGEQIDNLIQELKDFKYTYTDDILNAERDRLLQKSNIRENVLLNPTHKRGYVFIYKEHITNKYRLVATQNYQKRIVTLQYEYPTSLEIIAKKKTTDINILKEVMTDKYQKYNSHENWFDLTEEAISYFEDEKYQQEFETKKAEVDSSIYDSIVCDYCKNKKTNLDQDTYFICMLCKTTYCSEDCLTKAKHKCK